MGQGQRQQRKGELRDARANGGNCLTTPEQQIIPVAPERWREVWSHVFRLRRIIVRWCHVSSSFGLIIAQDMNTVDEGLDYLAAYYNARSCYFRIVIVNGPHSPMRPWPCTETLLPCSIVFSVIRPRAMMSESILLGTSV